MADIELDLECLGEELRVRDPPAGCVLAEFVEGWGEAGQVQLAAGVGGDLGLSVIVVVLVVVLVIQGSLSGQVLG